MVPLLHQKLRHLAHVRIEIRNQHRIALRIVPVAFHFLGRFIGVPVLDQDPVIKRRPVGPLGPARAMHQHRLAPLPRRHNLPNRIGIGVNIPRSISHQRVDMPLDSHRAGRLYFRRHVRIGRVVRDQRYDHADVIVRQNLANQMPIDLPAGVDLPGVHRPEFPRHPPILPSSRVVAHIPDRRHRQHRDTRRPPYPPQASSPRGQFTNFSVGCAHHRRCSSPANLMPDLSSAK